MNEGTRLIQTIKRQLKIRGLNYRDVALALGGFGTEREAPVCQRLTHP